MSAGCLPPAAGSVVGAGLRIRVWGSAVLEPGAGGDGWRNSTGRVSGRWR